MEINMIELNNRNDLLNAYDIYRHCMYMPSKEKFGKMIDSFLADNSIKIFACKKCNVIKGIIVISYIEQFKVEINGIAVDIDARGQGIGSYMINKLMNDYNILSIYAETDDDAIEFYRKNNFAITKFVKTYDGEDVVRYKCELKK